MIGSRPSNLNLFKSDVRTRKREYSLSVVVGQQYGAVMRGALGA